MEIYNLNDKSNEKTFFNLCVNDKLQEAKEFLKLNPDIIQHYQYQYNNRTCSCGNDLDCLFVCTCAGGKLEIMKWLYSIIGELTDLHRKGDYLFSLACERGHFLIAKWLSTIDDKKINYEAVDKSFRSACLNNSLEYAKWLYSFDPKPYEIIKPEPSLFDIVDFTTYFPRIDGSRSEYNSLFAQCCEGDYLESGNEHKRLNDNLELLKWLYSLGKVDIHSEDEDALRSACQRGRLDVMKWLYSLDGKINIRVDRDIIFFDACTTNNLELAKWIYSLDNTINVHTVHEINCMNDWLFKACCQWGHLKTAGWLYSFGGDFHIHENNNELLRMCINYGHTDAIEFVMCLMDEDTTDKSKN